jgi:hypothetical protein
MRDTKHNAAYAMLILGIAGFLWLGHTSKGLPPTTPYAEAFPPPQGEGMYSIGSVRDAYLAGCLWGLDGGQGDKGDKAFSYEKRYCAAKAEEYSGILAN